MASTIYTPSTMSSSDIKKMQQALVDAGYSVGASGVDGIWGANTSAALKQYKADTGGSNTYGNTVGNETLNKLYGTTSSSSGTSSSSSSKASTSSGTSSGTGIGTALQTIGGIVAQVASNPTIARGVTEYQMLNNSYDSQLDTLNSGYENYVSELESGANNANAALESARANALESIKSTYDDAARNYYRMYRSQEKELPEKLSSIGATGGASESAALALMSNYSDNLRQNETARNQDTNALNENYYDAVASNSIQLASQIAEAYLKQAQDVSALENQRYSDQQSIYAKYLQALADEKTAAQQSEVDSWNAKVAANIAKRTSQGYDPQTWYDADGKLHYTIAGQTSKKKVTDDDGSSGESDTTIGTTIGTTALNVDASDNKDYDSVKAQAKLRILGTNLLSGLYNSAGNSVVGAVNYINNSGLTTAQKNQLYKELGLA